MRLSSMWPHPGTTGGPQPSAPRLALSTVRAPGLTPLAPAPAQISGGLCSAPQLGKPRPPTLAAAWGGGTFVLPSSGGQWPEEPRRVRHLVCVHVRGGGGWPGAQAPECRVGARPRGWRSPPSWQSPPASQGAGTGAGWRLAPREVEDTPIRPPPIPDSETPHSGTRARDPSPPEPPAPGDGRTPAPVPRAGGWEGRRGPGRGWRGWGAVSCWRPVWDTPGTL